MTDEQINLVALMTSPDPLNRELFWQQKRNYIRDLKVFYYKIIESPDYNFHPVYPSILLPDTPETIALVADCINSPFVVKTSVDDTDDVIIYHLNTLFKTIQLSDRENPKSKLELNGTLYSLMDIQIHWKEESK